MPRAPRTACASRAIGAPFDLGAEHVEDEGFQVVHARSIRGRSGERAGLATSRLTSLLSKGLAPMTQTRRAGSLAIALLLAFAFLVPIARAQSEAPDALIDRLSTEAIETINTDEAIRAGDPQRLRALIDAKLMPRIDFRRMTASVVGPSWRRATPEQRARLEEEFKALLVRILSGALAQARASGSLAQARGKQVAVQPLRSAPGATEVTVRTELRGGGGDPIQLDYRLAKADGGWKIYDVNVLGVWMVQQYRSAFAREIDSGGIDGLIAALAQKNRVQ